MIPRIPTIASHLAAAMILVAAFARSVDAQWSGHVDLGSAMRREMPAERVAFPARFVAAAEHESKLGALSLSGQAVSAFAAGSRSDVVVTGAFDSRRLPWLAGLRAHVEGASAGTRLAEGVRRDRTEVGVGVLAHFLGADTRALVRQSSFVGTPTPRATTIDLQLARGIGNGALSIAGRRVGYMDSFVMQIDTLYRLADFEFLGTVDRLTSARRAYMEADAAVAWSFRGMALQAQGGMRFGADGVRGERWGRASLEIPLMSRIAVVGEVGHRMSLPEQRLPGYRFGSVSLRVHRSRTESRHLPPSARRADEPRVEVVAAANGVDGRSILVWGVDGSSVEIKGDFTDWQAVRLQAVAPRTWRFPASVPEGTHRVMMRVGDGPWRTPPGLPVVADDLGEAGLLVVEP